MIKATAGIIQNKDNKVLITRRKKGKHLEGYWEFAGGKIEGNETAEECLIREIKEELNIEILVNKHLANSVYDYETFKVELQGYLATYISGEIALTDHDAYEWIELNDFSKYKFAPADIPLIKALRYGI